MEIGEHETHFLLHTLPSRLRQAQGLPAFVKRRFVATTLTLTSSFVKVRKVAQHAVGAVLRGSCFMLRDGAPANHPAVHDTFEFCRKKLEERPSECTKL